jgi:ADP-heptose:LPS heptosyltransferase
MELHQLSTSPVNCKHWSPSNRPPIGLCAISAKDRPSPGACNACAKRDPASPIIDLILKNGQGAGDQVLLTAVVRDLHKTHPGRYRTAVDCWGTALFDSNPYVTPREQLSPNARQIVVEGFVASDDSPHLVTQFARSLSRKIDVHIDVLKLGGDVHLSRDERASAHPFDGEPYWLAWFGGHWGFTTKLWSETHAQAVVDHFRGKLRFVQVGASGHHHPKVSGATSLVGDTPMRRMVMLMYHAAGGIGPVSFGMHLSAAVPMAPTGLSSASRRPFIVLVGGREAPQVFLYPGHTAIGSIGRYRCCLSGACWKNNSHPGAGRKVDCEQVVLSDGLALARCMVEDVTPNRVIEAIELRLAAEADARASVHRQNEEAVAIAKTRRPVCAECPHLDHLSPGAMVVYCKSPKAHRCCGAPQAGAVSLSQQECPEGRWQTAEAVLT